MLTRQQRINAGETRYCSSVAKYRGVMPAIEYLLAVLSPCIHRGNFKLSASRGVSGGARIIKKSVNKRVAWIIALNKHMSAVYQMRHQNISQMPANRFSACAHLASCMGGNRKVKVVSIIIMPWNRKPGKEALLRRYNGSGIIAAAEGDTPLKCHCVDDHSRPGEKIKEKYIILCEAVFLRVSILVRACINNIILISSAYKY